MKIRLRKRDVKRRYYAECSRDYLYFYHILRINHFFRAYCCYCHRFLITITPKISQTPLKPSLSKRLSPNGTTATRTVGMSKPRHRCAHNETPSIVFPLHTHLHSRPGRQEPLAHSADRGQSPTHTRGSAGERGHQPSCEESNMFHSGPVVTMTATISNV